MSDVIAALEELTPKLLTDWLRPHGLLPDQAVTRIVERAPRPVAHATVHFLKVVYAPPATHLPERFVLKLAVEQSEWADREAIFYQVLAPQMSAVAPHTAWLFPRCLAVAYDRASGRSHFLFEDLSATHVPVPEGMPDALDLACQAVAAYARFHAFWWEHPWLGNRVGTLLTDEVINTFLTTAQTKWQACVAYLGQALAPQDRRILHQIAQAWPDLRRRRLIQGQGITLVHRDPHPRNLLYPRSPGQGQVKLLDWESWRVDSGTDDIAYLMACHWPVERLVLVEEELLRVYHNELEMHGVSGYSWDACLYDYRASIIRCLFFLLVAWSPAQWTGGSWRSRVARALAAYRRWDCDRLFAPGIVDTIEAK